VSRGRPLKKASFGTLVNHFEDEGNPDITFAFADYPENLCVTHFQVTDVWTLSSSVLASLE
jgi:hypothetical protein